MRKSCRTGTAAGVNLYTGQYRFQPHARGMYVVEAASDSTKLFLHAMLTDMCPHFQLVVTMLASA